MKLTNVLCEASTDEFKAKAYADYLEDVNATYMKLIAAFNAVAQQDEIDPEDYDGPGNPYDAIILAALEEAGLPADVLEAKLTLSNGYTDVRSALQCVAQGIEAYANADAEGGAAALEEGVCTLYRFGHTGEAEMVASGLKASANQILSDLNSALHSAVATQAAFAAAAISDVTERVTVFGGKIRQFFADEFNDISNTANYYRNLLMDKANSAKALCQSFIQSMGAVARIATDSDGLVEDTELATFTGASPLPALDFSTAAKVVSTTAKVIAGVVSTVATTLFSIGKSIFNWGKKKVENFFEPFDLEVVDKSADASSIDGWAVQEANVTSTVYNASEAETEWMESHAGKWMKYEFFFGEALYRFDNVRTYGTGVRADVTFQLKPYPVKPQAIIDALSAAGISCDENYSHTSGGVTQEYLFWAPLAGVTYAQYITFLRVLKESDFLYQYNDTEQDNELLAYYSFKCGLDLLKATLIVGTDEANASSDSDFINPTAAVLQYLGYNVCCPKITLASNHTTPTNAQFLQVASGWNGDTTTPEYGCKYCYGWVSGYAELQVGYISQFIADGLLSSLVVQSADRAENPLDYMFLPYRDNVASFLTSKYGIKTDQQNQKALTTFLTILVVVVIAAVVATTSAVLIKKAARRRFFKRTAFVGEMDNAMWNGNKEFWDNSSKKRRYLRYQRKLQGSSSLTAGMQQSSLGSIVSSLAGDGGLSSMFSIFSSSQDGFDAQALAEQATQGQVLAVQGQVTETSAMQLRATQDGFATDQASLAAIKRVLKHAAEPGESPSRDLKLK